MFVICFESALFFELAFFLFASLFASLFAQKKFANKKAFFTFLYKIVLCANFTA